MPRPSPTPFTPVPCSDITPMPVSWLWEPYLARGKLAVLDGDPGTGKSFLTLDLAARISAGMPMPGSQTSAPGVVLLLNAEDDARDTIGPRVAAAGGDLERVRIFYSPGIGQEWTPRFPDDILQLTRAVTESAATLVVIDPLPAFFAPEVSTNSDQSARLALMPLAALAAETNACVLLVRHLRKTGGANAIYRGSGSMGIMGVVRTGLMIARHPDDSELRVLTLSKTNIGPPGRSLGFRLRREEHSGHSVVSWTGPIDVSVDDLLGAYVPLRAGSRTRERAVEWLREFLSAGARRATEVESSAREAGIPDRTLRRVKETVGAVSEAVSHDGKVEWWWRDPAADRARQSAERAELRTATSLLLHPRRSSAPRPTSDNDP